MMFQGEAETLVNPFEDLKIYRLTSLHLNDSEIQLVKHLFENGPIEQNKAQTISNLDKLNSLGYISINEEIALNKQFLFSNLENKQSFYKINCESISYDDKLKAKYSVEKIKTLLSQYLRIDNLQKCFRVCYQLEF